MSIVENFDGGKTNFVNVTGTLQVIQESGTSNYVGQAVASSSGFRCILNNIFTDSTTESKVKLIKIANTSSYTIGLMVRYTDTNNYYLFIYENGKLMITKKVAGTITQLASMSYSMTLNTWYSFRAVVKGSNLEFKINNTPMLTATDSSHTTGKCGYVAFNTTSQIDNYTITADVIPPVNPEITGFSPTSGLVGTTVSIQGVGFEAVSEVIFGAASTPPNSVSATQIVATVPSGATSGPIKIKMGSVVISSTDSFTVQTPPPTTGPYITSFVPSSGEIGTSVVIQGGNLEYTTGIAFNGTSAQFSNVSEGSVSAVVPQGATTGKIEAISYAISPMVFTVDEIPPPVEIPTVSGYSPASGKVGTQIMISGTNLQLIVGAYIGDVPATYSGVSTLITLMVPQLTVGAYPIFLKYNVSELLFVGQFTVIEEPPPPPGGKILYHFNAAQGQGILELENDQNTSWAYKITNDPVLNKPAYRFECRSAFSGGDSQRSELKIYRKDWHATFPGEYWYGFKLMLDSSWITGGDRWNMCGFQSHQIGVSG